MLGDLTVPVHILLTASGTPGNMLLSTVVVLRHEQDVCSEVINNNDSCMEVCVLLPLWHNVLSKSGWQRCHI